MASAASYDANDEEMQLKMAAVNPVPPQTTQPVGTSSIQFMPPPPRIPGVPAGLEYLAQIDQLLIHQQVEMFEALSGIEMCNKYQIKNSLGQQVYFAGEESGACARCWCGPLRGFFLHITDNFWQEVIRIDRRFKCCGFGCPACAGCGTCAIELDVEAPVGVTVGHVIQQRSCITMKCVVEDAQEKPVFVIEGPFCCACQDICCTGDLEYRILSADGEHEIGVISKQWAGCFKESCTDADNFGLTFPVDLDVRMKATLIGAVFLIDFGVFETPKNNNN